MKINGRTLAALGRDYQSSEKGTVALIFGLAALVLFLVTGLAIDVGRVMHAERKIASAIDAAWGALSHRGSLPSCRSGPPYSLPPIPAVSRSRSSAPM